jgi:peptidoglycan/LPS O-acetylase OafA/YrhL
VIINLASFVKMFNRSKQNRHELSSCKKATRKKEIDGFRALAVLVVVVSHLGLRSAPGQTGVLLFFVISGYVITGSILREVHTSGEFSIMKFFGRRAFKLLPPLFLIILIPSLMFVDDISVRILVSQMFFYFNWQYLTTLTQGILPGSAVVWSLSVEEQYYIGVAITVATIVRFAKANFVKYLTLTYLTVFLASFLSRLFLFFSDDKQNSFGDVSRILYGTDTRVSSIAAGGLVAIYLQSNSFLKFHLVYFEKYKLLIFLALVTLSLMSVYLRDDFFRNTFKYTIQEFVCTILIILVSRDSLSYKFIKGFLSWKWLQLVGISSYSIYLSHLVLIHFFSDLEIVSSFGEENIFELTGNNLGESCVVLVTVLVLGIFLHYIADRPFERMRDNIR